MKDRIVSLSKPFLVCPMAYIKGLLFCIHEKSDREYQRELRELCVCVHQALSHNISVGGVRVEEGKQQRWHS